MFEATGICPQNNWHSDYLKEFLKQQDLNRGKSWILAISAGVDSSVLLDAFVILLKRQSSWLPQAPAQLIVASFDHGWREQSKQEIEYLRSYVQMLQQEGLNIEFETQQAKNPISSSSNLEDYARKQRYDFFENVARRHKTDYVFLAHHSDDRRETLLKNILEGKELAFLHGMRSSAYCGFLRLLRPWLKIEKSQLQACAKWRGLTYFEDSTNNDERFLRARMRNKIFPTLDASWPKAWRKGLDQVALYSEEIFCEFRQFFQEQDLQPQPALGGWQWLLPNIENRLAIRFFLRLASSHLEPLGREGSQKVLEGIEQNKRHWKFRTKNFLWLLEPPFLYALHPTWHLPSSEVSWDEPLHGPEVGESTTWGPWVVQHLRNLPVGKHSKLPNWQDIASGSFYVPLLSTTSGSKFSSSWLHLGLLSAHERSKVLHRMQRRSILAHTRPWVPLFFSDVYYLFNHPPALDGVTWLHWRWSSVVAVPEHACRSLQTENK